MSEKRSFTLEDGVLLLDGVPVSIGQMVVTRYGEKGEPMQGIIERTSKGVWVLSHTKHVGHPYLNAHLNEKTMKDIEVLSSDSVYENPFAESLADAVICPIKCRCSVLIRVAKCH